MKKIAILAILAIACTTLFSACGKKADTKEVPEETVAAMSVDDVLANAGQLLGDTITIEGGLLAPLFPWCNESIHCRYSRLNHAPM